MTAVRVVVPVSLPFLHGALAMRAMHELRRHSYCLIIYQHLFAPSLCSQNSVESGLER